MFVTGYRVAVELDQTKIPVFMLVYIYILSLSTTISDESLLCQIHNNFAADLTKEPLPFLNRTFLAETRLIKEK